MPSYRVVAPLVLVRDERGRTHHAYEGVLVDVVDADHAAYLVAEGMLAVEGAAPVASTTDVVEVSAPVDVVGDPDPVEVPRPAHVNPKARWVDFAVSQGFAREDAEGMSKQALIAALS